MINDLAKILGVLLLIVVVVFGLAALLAYPTMWVVNYTFAPSALTAVFGTSSIGFWKALWLNMFFGIAFKSTNYTDDKKK